LTCWFWAVFEGNSFGWAKTQIPYGNDKQKDKGGNAEDAKEERKGRGGSIVPRLSENGVYRSTSRLSPKAAIMRVMAKVLDLDLDFFSWPIVRGPVDGRPSDDEYKCASPNKVRLFLESQCGLSRERKILGHFCSTHDGAFDAWKRWIAERTLEAGFEVDHVDAHSDLSFGDASWYYILTEFLNLPLASRSEPERGVHRLNEGTYLTFAIANRWITSLSYVYPVPPNEEATDQPDETDDGYPSDLNRMLFRNQEFDLGLIELQQVTTADADQMMCGSAANHPISIEPAVPIRFVPGKQFSGSEYTHMILAHSAEYCPPATDELISVIQEYFAEA